MAPSSTKLYVWKIVVDSASVSILMIFQFQPKKVLLHIMYKIVVTWVLSFHLSKNFKVSFPDQCEQAGNRSESTYGKQQRTVRSETINLLHCQNYSHWLTLPHTATWLATATHQPYYLDSISYYYHHIHYRQRSIFLMNRKI